MNFTATVKSWFLPWRAYVAEFLGTFVFVFLTCAAVLANELTVDIGTVGIALTAGFSYAAAVFATVSISGGNLNPAVSVGLWLAGKIASSVLVFYVAAQILASILAAWLLYLIFGDSGLKFFLGAPALGNDVTLTTALIVEAVASAILIFVYFATLVDKRGPVSFGPLVLGLVITAATIFAFSISGAAFNPARAVGPALILRSYDFLVIYAVGPLIGSLFAIIYDFLFLKSFRKTPPG